MEDLVDSLTHVNVSQVKTVLVSVAAVLLVVVTVALVTAKIGPGLDSSELREREERQEERLEQREERFEEGKD
ncbi:MAG: hypothetical protein ACRDJT_09280 [Actinomycetota bacterium]